MNLVERVVDLRRSNAAVAAKLAIYLGWTPETQNGEEIMRQVLDLPWTDSHTDHPLDQEVLQDGLKLFNKGRAIFE